MSSEVKRRLLEHLKGHFEDGPFRITPQELATEADAEEEDALAVLESLVRGGRLTRSPLILCGCEKDEQLDTEAATKNTCVHCGLAFGKDVGTPRRFVVFVHRAPATRDVPWVLTLHGMNTRGPWQEEFMWRVSRTYGHSVPVAIYKYGIVRPGAILKFRLRALTRGLSVRIRQLTGDAARSGFGGVPDVIAHSLGTLLLGHALREDASLRVGRVILTGCILRPDFDWSALIARGQVECVLCHVAASDFWAWVTHYLIPDSGPSGRLGFNDLNAVSHVTSPGKGHSDCFALAEMPTVFDTVWKPFLTRPANSPTIVADDLPSRSWRQAWWLLRATLPRWFVLAVAVVILAAAAAIFAFGVRDLWQLWNAHA